MAPPDSEALRHDEVLLEAFGLRVRLVPSQGGRITSLVAHGREWLWRNPALQPPLPVVAPGGYVEAHDDGGWDEIFPNLAPVEQADGTYWPDHGELWSRSWKAEQRGSQVCVTRVTSQLLPVRMSRTLSLEDPARLRVDYVLEHLGEMPLSFMWAAHPLFAVGPGDRWVSSRPLAWWPEQEGADLPPCIHAGILPARQAGLAAKAFAAMPPDGRLELHSAGHLLVLHTDPAQVPHLGLWLNAGGWAGVPDATPYFNLALEPCIGPSDRFSEAIRLAPGPTTLEPGESRRWWLSLEFPLSEACL
ncbi:MAG: hypothetical protein VKO21_05755 [Candidatus Sericytochromatia bacterium]|nr:hypothetical protein [Candidatus Sericytochromatia bacterium]